MHAIARATVRANEPSHVRSYHTSCPHSSLHGIGWGPGGRAATQLGELGAGHGYGSYRYEWPCGDTWAQKGYIVSVRTEDGTSAKFNFSYLETGTVPSKGGNPLKSVGERLGEVGHKRQKFRLPVDNRGTHSITINRNAPFVMSSLAQCAFVILDMSIARVGDREAMLQRHVLTLIMPQASGEHNRSASRLSPPSPPCPRPHLPPSSPLLTSPSGMPFPKTL